MKTCPECHNSGKIWCPACKGNNYGSDKKCIVCHNKGLVTCYVCGGTGKIDDNDDYKRSW